MTRLPQGKPISRAALAAVWVFSLAVLPAALGQETSPAPPTDIPGLVAQLGARCFGQSGDPEPGA